MPLSNFSCTNMHCKIPRESDDPRDSFVFRQGRFSVSRRGLLVGIIDFAALHSNARECQRNKRCDANYRRSEIYAMDVGIIVFGLVAYRFYMLALVIYQQIVIGF